MKTFTLFTIIVILLLTNQMFSQVNNKLELRPDNLLQERIIPHSIQNKKTTHPLKSDIVKSNNSRTLVNKMILDNGFLLIEELYQIWDGSNWVNIRKYTYTYDGNNMIESLRLQWDGGSNWVNDSKTTYIYDGNNNMIERLWQFWDGFNWLNYWKYTYTYDVNNNLIEELKQTWDGYNWANNSKTAYTYIITGIEQSTDGIETYSLSNNYPNPFNPSTTITYSVPEIEFVTLKIYDVLGNEIAILVNEEKSVGSYEVEFYGVGVVSGIYFYRLQAGSFVETKKMVLMK